DRLSLGQLIVTFHCRCGFLAMIPDALVAQQLEGFGATLKRQLHPARENDHSAAVIEQLLDICRPNPWNMMRTCFSPIPPTPAATVQLEVASGAQPFYLHPSPRNVIDSRRGFLLIVFATHRAHSFTQLV